MEIYSDFSHEKSWVFHSYLFGALEHVVFSHILGMSSSQLTFIFFREVGIPPTSDVSQSTRG